MIKTGNKNFWIAQIVGWVLLAVSNLLVQYLAGVPEKILLINSLIPMTIGFLLTTIYRQIIRKLKWHKWNFNKSIAFLAGSTFILTVVFMLLVFIVILIIKGLHGLTIASFLGTMFSFTLVLLTWNLIYFAIHYFNNWTQAEIERWKLEAVMKEAQLGSLKSQIRPHFVFNTINNIRSLILEDEEKAREMLLNFSDLFRYALKNTDQSKVTLSEELEIVNQYLELLSIQYDDKLNFKIQVEEGLELIELPPMILQLLVENAVKHGISQSSKGGSILIDIDKKKDFLNIRVQNSGNLNKSSGLEEHLGVGLDNVKRRLELIYCGKAALKVHEIENNVVAAIKIPIER
jgi:sensor histidine kinase YesM